MNDEEFLAPRCALCERPVYGFARCGAHIMWCPTCYATWKAAIEAKQEWTHYLEKLENRRRQRRLVRIRKGTERPLSVESLVEAALL